MLPTAGDISLSQVNTELGLPSTNQISFNDAAVRTLFGTSTIVDLNSAHGKSNVTFTIVAMDYNSKHNIMGYQVGYFGSCSPTTLRGYVIQFCYTLPSSDGFYFAVIGYHPQNWFNSITIAGKTFYTSQATWTDYSSAVGMGYCAWTWASNKPNLVFGGSYPVVIA